MFCDIFFRKFSDIYTKKGNERKLSVMVCGRTNKNFKEFNQQLDYSYLKGLIYTIFEELLGEKPNFEEGKSDNYDLYEKIYFKGSHIGRIGRLSKNFVDSKVKTPVFSFEISINDLAISEKKYQKTSDFPASYRDLSFSLDSHDSLSELSNVITKITGESDLLTDTFIFDLFENKKLNILKVGYRFKFQSIEKSLTDEEIDKVMDSLIKNALSVNGINIEGL